jgi:hypothetical protein
LFGPPYQLSRGGKGLSWFLWFNIANRLLGRKIAKEATGAYGKQGDVYFFINDVWHGREPNIHGRSGIKVMIGAFPADDPFPDEVIPPDRAILAQLPPLVRRAAGQTAVPVAAGGTILKRVRVRQSESRPGLIFTLARLERKFADVISSIVGAPIRGARMLLRPLVTKFARSSPATVTS